MGQARQITVVTRRIDDDEIAYILHALQYARNRAQLGIFIVENAVRIALFEQKMLRHWQ